MQMPENSKELSQQLSEVLLAHGERQMDKIQHIVVSSALGEVKLNDYWNGFHKNHAGGRHYSNPDSFYAEGNIPILGLSNRKIDVSVLVFQPADMSLQGIGRNIVDRLPEELQASSTVLSLKRDIVLSEPLQDPDLEQLLSVF
jgi:hypothetical protein